MRWKCLGSCLHPAAAMPVFTLGLAMGRAQTYIYMEYKYISMGWGVFPSAGAAVKGWGLDPALQAQKLVELNCACKAKGPV